MSICFIFNNYWKASCIFSLTFAIIQFLHHRWKNWLFGTFEISNLAGFIGQLLYLAADFCMNTERQASIASCSFNTYTSMCSCACEYHRNVQLMRIGTKTTIHIYESRGWKGSRKGQRKKNKNRRQAGHQ